MKPMIKCPECYNTNLYKFSKDKNSNKKYLCKKYRRQFILQSSKKHSLGYPKYPVCGKGMSFTINTSIMLALNIIIES